MVLSPVSVLSNRERNQSVWNILLLGSVQITSHIQRFKRGNDLFSEGLVQFNSESHWVWMKHKSRIVVRIEPKSWLTWPVYSFKQIKWSSHLCMTSPFKFCQHSPFKIEGCAIAHWMRFSSNHKSHPTVQTGEWSLLWRTSPIQFRVTLSLNET